MFDDINFLKLPVKKRTSTGWRSVKKYNIGLWRSDQLERCSCNAITGECKDYKVEDIDLKWVTYTCRYACKSHNYYGTLKHGFINRILWSERLSDHNNGYNYLAINDDVWVYTGVVSSQVISLT